MEGRPHSFSALPATASIRTPARAGAVPCRPVGRAGAGHVRLRKRAERTRGSGPECGASARASRYRKAPHGPGRPWPPAGAAILGAHLCPSTSGRLAPHPCWSGDSLFSLVPPADPGPRPRRHSPRRAG